MLFGKTKENNCRHPIGEASTAKVMSLDGSKYASDSLEVKIVLNFLSFSQDDDQMKILPFFEALS